MTSDEAVQFVADHDGMAYLKYVQMADGEYRFDDVSGSHSDLAGEEIPISAGFVKICLWADPPRVFVDGSSSMLKMGPNMRDYEALPLLFLP